MANVLIKRFFTRSLGKFKQYSTFTTIHPSVYYILPSILPKFNQSPCLSILHKNLTNSVYVYCGPIKYYSIDANKKIEGFPEKGPRLSVFQKFKQMYRDYWYVLVPVHLVTSAGWFGAFYYLAKSGVDIVALLETMSVSEKITNSLKDSSMGYIALSYALYKIATPARYAVTLGGTTISINYLKKWGYIKPVPSKDRLKEMYQEKKDNIMESVREKTDIYKEKKDNLIDSMRETKDTLKLRKKNILKEKEMKK